MRVARSRIQPSMYYNSRILLLLPEVAWNIMGTMWIFGSSVECSDEHFTRTVTEGTAVRFKKRNETSDGTGYLVAETI